MYRDDDLGIKFETDAVHNSFNYVGADLPKMVAFVISHSGGKITNRKQAEIFLLILVGVLFLFAILIPYIFGSGGVETLPHTGDTRTVI